MSSYAEDPLPEGCLSSPSPDWTGDCRLHTVVLAWAPLRLHPRYSVTVTAGHIHILRSFRSRARLPPTPCCPLSDSPVSDPPIPHDSSDTLAPLGVSTPCHSQPACAALAISIHPAIVELQRMVDQEFCVHAMPMLELALCSTFPFFLI